MAVLLALLAALPCEAQVRWGSDLSFVSRYEWRGLTRGSGWAFQPDLFASLGSERVLTVGIWSTVQLSRTDPATGLGFERSWFAEGSPWVELSGAFEGWELAAGWTAHFLDAEGAASASSLEDTQEIYVRGRLRSLPVVVPAVAYFHDIDAVRGGYLETRLAVRVPVWPGVVLPVGSLFLTGTAGFSLGQESADDPTEAAHFEDRGLTHWDLSLSFPSLPFLRVGPLEVAGFAELHVQLNRDPATRLTARDESSSTTVWWRFGVAALGPRCRPERAVCDP